MNTRLRVSLNVYCAEPRFESSHDLSRHFGSFRDASSSSYFGFSHQGSPQRIFLLRFCLPSVSSYVTSTSAMSSFTTSINLFLAFPVFYFLATPSSASVSQYTHHLSSVDVHITPVLPLGFSPQTFPPL